MNQLIRSHSALQGSNPLGLDYFLLDASGSMAGQNWNESLRALDAYVAELSVLNTQSHVILATFTTGRGEVDIDYQVHRSQPVRDWVPLWSQQPQVSMSGTPLYDAIQMMCWELRDINPERCAITVATDGGENGSHFTDLDTARALLDWCRARGWQVTFIGCEFNNTRLGQSLGADSSTAIGVQATKLVEASKSLARKRAHYQRTGDSMGFDESERQQFGGYLAAPGAAR